MWAKLVMGETRYIRGGYLPSREAPQKINFDDFFTCNGRKLGRHFLSSCSKVNSAGYSEFDEPISARV